MKFEFSPQKSQITPGFNLIGTTKEKTVALTRKPDGSRIETVRTTATTVDNTNTYLGGTTQAASFGLGLLNLDASGNLMKLSQMQKIYCRFRFIDINHGIYLSQYFEWSASKFDP